MNFRHEALFYAGAEEFLDGTVPFVREGVAAGEPVLVAVTRANTERLVTHLGLDAAHVHFADMETLGRNPARIISAWQEFVAGQRGPIRGIGEPAWPGRTRAEITECHRHESLLNLAFAGTPSFRLLCPYDAAALAARDLAHARRTHPLVATGSEPPAVSRDYVDACAPFEGELSEPAVEPHELAFNGRRLGSLRHFVATFAQRSGLGARRVGDVVVAVNELAANTLRHADGRGTVRVWREDGALVCEVRDRGRFEQPLAGRLRPPDSEAHGRGLWMVNHLCDLVQIRSGGDGSVVRLRVRLD